MRISEKREDIGYTKSYFHNFLVKYENKMGENEVIIKERNEELVPAKFERVYGKGANLLEVKRVYKF